MRGRGETGKSTCVNAVRNTLGNNEEAVMATTGKAATVIGGSTVFSKKNGLALPVGKGAFKKLPNGPILGRLQEKFRDTRVIFIDECSMLHQKHLYFIDQRLRQIKCNDKIFGGIAVVLIGDTGQLPAVKGRVMWEEKPKNQNDVAGLHLYR